MSRIRLIIDRLVLNGFDPREGKALASALQSQLQQVLADPATRNEWAHPHRTPVVKLGRIPLQPDAVGASRFGKQMGRAVGRGLKP
jgi:hypothetical protein